MVSHGSVSLIVFGLSLLLNHFFDVNLGKIYLP